MSTRRTGPAAGRALRLLPRCEEHGTRTLVVLLVCALAASSLVAPAAATVPAGNLLADPGAEQGGAATDSAHVVAPPAPWVPEGPFTQVAYGTPDFPSTAVAESRVVA